MFFQQVARHGDKLAIIDGDRQISYAQLAELCDELAESLASLHSKAVIFILAKDSLSTVVAYLTCLQQGHCAMLLSPNSSEQSLAQLQAQYQPHCILSATDDLLPAIHWCEKPHTQSLCADLALLLSTSGSTGSAKQVALSFANLHNNAQMIVNYLPITEQDRALCTLPLFYSYGLSVLNSHLLVGACCVFTSFSMVNREYWQLFDDLKINSFAGVPHSYQMLKRLRFTQKSLPYLRYFTQAGGKLDADSVLELAEYAQQQGKQFYVMYGQTEATARMAYLAPEKVLSKPQSIGQAIPAGQLSLMDDNGTTIEAAHIEGELVYSGQNVMLGYASKVQDLAHFEPTAVLHTGDLGYRDDEGDYFITGRIKRIIKPFGQRISLDDAERVVSEKGYPAYCAGDDQILVVAILNPQEPEKSDWAKGLKRQLASHFALHVSAIEVLVLNQLPINENGKKDYLAIMKRYQDGQLYDD